MILVGRYLHVIFQCADMPIDRNVRLHAVHTDIPTCVLAYLTQVCTCLPSTILIRFSDEVQERCIYIYSCCGVFPRAFSLCELQFIMCIHQCQYTHMYCLSASSISFIFLTFIFNHFNHLVSHRLENYHSIFPVFPKLDLLTFCLCWCESSEPLCPRHKKLNFHYYRLGRAVFRFFVVGSRYFFPFSCRICFSWKKPIRARQILGWSEFQGGLARKRNLLKPTLQQLFIA